MELLLILIYTAVFCYLILKLPFFSISGIKKKYFVFVFLAKVLCGILMYFLYTYHYTDRATADIFKYFDDGNIMYQSIHNNPSDYFSMLTGINNEGEVFTQYYNEMTNWYRKYESSTYNDNHTIIRFNAFVRLFSFGFYNVHNVFMNFLSFIGLFAILKFFIYHLPTRIKEVFFAVFLLPSVMFWGSGVLKEGILFFGFGMLLFSLYQSINNKKTIYLLGLILSVFILKYTKPYILYSLLPLIFAYVWVEKKPKFALLKYLSLMSIFMIAAVNLYRVFPQYDLFDIFTLKQIDFISLARVIESGSTISIPKLEPSFSSFLINSPLAFFTTLFRPFIFESGSLLLIIAGLENLFIIIIIAFYLWHKKYDKNKVNLLCFSIFFVVITFCLTGLITPVLGAVVRYKIPALPFLITIFIILSDKSRLEKRAKVLK